MNTREQNGENGEKQTESYEETWEEGGEETQQHASEEERHQNKNVENMVGTKEEHKNYIPNLGCAGTRDTSW